MHNFPFWINAYDFAEVQGICNFEANKLNFEIQTKDALLGILKTKPKVVSFNLSDIASLELKTDWFGGLFYRKLKLQLKTMALADKLPGNDINGVTISFKRKYLRNVKSLIDDLNYSIGMKKLDDIDRKFLDQ